MRIVSRNDRRIQFSNSASIFLPMDVTRYEIIGFIFRVSSYTR